MYKLCGGGGGGSGADFILRLLCLVANVEEEDEFLVSVPSLAQGSISCCLDRLLDRLPSLERLRARSLTCDILAKNLLTFLWPLLSLCLLLVEFLLLVEEEDVREETFGRRRGSLSFVLELLFW